MAAAVAGAAADGPHSFVLDRMTVNETDLRPNLNQWRALYGGQFEKFLLTFAKPESHTSPADNTAAPQLGSARREDCSRYEHLALQAVEIGLKTLFVDLHEICSWPHGEGDDLADFLQGNYLEVSVEVDNCVELFFRQTVAKYSPDDVASVRRDQFRACFYNPTTTHTVRSIRCDAIGRLVNLRATVTRASDIRPELRVASFECEVCSRVVDGVEQLFKYTEPSVCSDKQCGNRTRWSLRQSGCEFHDWQKIRVQENASEIPAGSMPRAIDVIVRGDVCDRCKAGDKVIVAGCVLAVPDVPSLMKPGQIPKSVARDKMRHERSEFGLQDNAIKGLRNLGVRDLGYRLCFLGTHVRVVNAGDEEEYTAPDATRREEEESGPFAALSHQDRDLFLQIAESQNCLGRLAQHVAPQIHGHEEIKKGILLMIVGGVEKSTEKEAIKLRGDINACIVGDPGTAKSQLLKFVQGFVGRGVYTSGKSSTSAGLTASVNRDIDQGDAVIEAGALMLADRGVCCIDEFDKMDEKDMVAIHEAMEQQTISIAKAGIQATLNARASVFAACNPAGGRYDPSKTFRQNVRLSAPIMSRFDLFFVMVDDIQQDEIVAKHMVKVHANSGMQQSTDDAQFSRKKLQQYTRIARSFRPKITDEAREVIKTAWIALRQQDVQPGGMRNIRITVRQLESLIRLSEADAKLRFSDEVLTHHVEEAYTIYHDSLTKVKKGRIDLAEDEDSDDETTQENGNRRDECHIDSDEFERVAQMIVDYLAEHENAVASGGEACEYVTRDALVTW
eukprot:Lankesteria_metandrocarpae@DN4498_c0_g1_i1.p1